MKIKKRLRINIAVSVVAALLIILIGFVALTRIKRGMDEAEIANKIMNTAFERTTFRNDYLRTSSERARKQWFGRSEELGILLKAASDTFKDADRKRAVSELMNEHEETVKLFSEIVQNRENARAGAVPAELSEETEDRLVTQLNIKAYERVLRTTQLREAARERLFATLRMAVWTTFLVMAVMAAAATINSWIIDRTIINRIRLLRDGSSIIGEGNLDHRLESKGDDEFADLSNAFNAMTVKLKASQLELKEEIADRKRAEESLRESERRERERAEELAAMLNAVPTPVIIVHDPDSTHMTGNPAADELLRRPRGAEISLSAQPEVKPRHFRAIKDGRELRIDELPAQRAARGERVQDFEFSIVFDDGATRHLLGYGTPLLDDRGRPRGAVHVLVDITDRKRVEDELRMERNRAQRYLDIAGVLIIVLNRDQSVALINQKGCEILGRHENEIVGKNWFDNFLPAENRERVQKVFNDIMRGEIAPVEYYENSVVTSGGGLRLIAWHNSIIKDESGQITGALSSGEDITERKRSEAEINELNKELTWNIYELESANKELEAFIYSVAHDLRAPLRSIAGFSELLLKGQSDKTDKKRDEHLARIIHGAEQMNKIIDDLLHLSKISRHEMHKADVDMSRILKSLVKELQTARPGRRATVDIKEGMIAFADAGLIQVALSNLLNNAWKFTSRTPHAKIECGSIDQAGKTVYYVKDNGAGFDQRFAERMFLPFHRLHTEQEFEGTGIGLAIVERVIRRHGGKIWAEGRKNEGATFFFTLS